MKENFHNLESLETAVLPLENFSVLKLKDLQFAGEHKRPKVLVASDPEQGKKKVMLSYESRCNFFHTDLRIMPTMKSKERDVWQDQT